MYPTQGILFSAPFTDDSLYSEQLAKANFWYQQYFHGVDLSALRGAAIEEYLRQPILDTFDVRILMAKPQGYTTDFSTAEESDLLKIVIPLSFKLWSTGTIHGLAVWFDVAFVGSQSTVWLSTAPFQPLTHWYQIRCLLRNPIFARTGQQILGTMVLTANERQSYDIEIDVHISGTNIRSANTYDLKNPNFRYMTAPAPPPGSYHTCPSEQYWEAQTQQQPQPLATAAHASHQHSVQQVHLGLSSHEPQVITSGYHASRQSAPVMSGFSSTDQSSAVPVAVVNGGVLSPKTYTPSANAQTFTTPHPSHLHGYLPNPTAVSSNVSGRGAVNMSPASPPGGTPLMIGISGAGETAGRAPSPQTRFLKQHQQKLSQQPAALRNHTQS